MATDPREIELDEDDQNLLAQAADAVGKPWRQLLRQAVSHYLPPRRPHLICESALEVAQRLGLVGCAPGLPPDLSTGPRYMEGFGETSGE